MLERDAKTKTGLLTGTEHSFEHPGGEGAKAVVALVVGSGANKVAVSSIKYGGQSLVSQEAETNGTSPYPHASVWFLDGISGGTQTVEIVKHAEVDIQVIIVTLLHDGEALTVGDVDGGSGNNEEAAVPALEATSAGLGFAAIMGEQDDLPVIADHKLLDETDFGERVMDAREANWFEEDDVVFQWLFGAKDLTARVGIALLDPNPPPPPSTFEADAESGDLSEFPYVQAILGRVTVPSAYALQGGNSYRFEVQGGDEEPDTGSQRAEGTNNLRYHPEDVRYFRFLTRVEAWDWDFWGIIWQMHDSGGEIGTTPPISLQLKQEEDGSKWLWLGPGSGATTFWKAPFPGFGVTFEIVLKVVFGEGEAGSIEVWLNGEKQAMLEGEGIDTIGIPSDYDKIGIYRDGDSVETAVVVHDDYRIGEGFFSEPPVPRRRFASIL